MGVVKQIVVYVTVAVLVALSSSGAHAQAAHELKKRYLSLRNTDPLVHRKADWETLAQELSSQARQIDPTLTLDASRLYFELFKNYGDSEYYEKGTSAIKVMLKDKKASLDKRSEAKLLECAWIENAQHQPSQVEDCRRSVVEQFPGTESALFAEGLLSGQHGAGVEVSQQVILPSSAPLVVIDAGHGGEDFGAVGYANLYEKDVTLLLSRSIAKILNTRYRIRTELTRTKDQFMPLEERTAFANAKKADAFVSIHANASEKRTMNGFEVYYLDNAENKGSELLAQRENDSAQQQLSDIGFILSDMIQQGKIPASKTLATTIEKNVARLSKDKNFSLKSNGVRKAPFYVLVGAHMPCVLVETSYIDHAQEGKKLGDERFRQKLAETLAAGIAQFLKDMSHE